MVYRIIKYRHSPDDKREFRYMVQVMKKDQWTNDDWFFSEDAAAHRVRDLQKQHDPSIKYGIEHGETIDVGI